MDEAMAPPTSTLFSTLDLLCCIGQQIKNTRSLSALCLVNHVFNEAFTPALYLELRFNSINPEREGSRLSKIAAAEPHLKHTRLLSFHRRYPEDTIWSSGALPFNKTLGELLKKMPMLETFECIGVLLSDDTLQTLRIHCPRIQSIAFVYEESAMLVEAPDIPPPYLALDFSRFSNLRSLCLEHIFGDLSETGWQATLVRILSASPELQELSLSIHHEALRLYARVNPHGCKEILRDLCNAYAACGAQPLSLRSLRLGLGFVLWMDEYRKSRVEARVKHASTWALLNGEKFAGYPATYLMHLTKLDCLEEVHIENEDAIEHTDGHGVLGLKYEWGQEWCNDRDHIAWGTFLPEWTPNLRYLSWHWTTPTVVEFLSALEDRYSARLAVIERYDDQFVRDSQAELSPHISHGSVHSIDALDEDDALGGLFPEGDGSATQALAAEDPDHNEDTDRSEDNTQIKGPYGCYNIRRIESEADSPPVGFRMLRLHLVQEMDTTVRSTKRILRDLVAAQGNTVEGLAILNESSNNMSILEPYLAGLPKLTQLLIDGPGLGTVAIVSEQEAREKEAKRKEQAAALAKHSSSLQYIKLNVMGWEVIRSADGQVSRLVDLDVSDEQRMELFRQRRLTVGDARSSFWTMA